MKTFSLLVFSVLISGILTGQQAVIENQVITNEPLNCLFPKFLLNENGETFIVYYNKGFICYDLLSAKMEKRVERGELQPATTGYEKDFTLSLLDNNHFVLFWIDNTSGQINLQCRLFDRFGLPKGKSGKIGNVNHVTYHVSKKPNAHNEICISYNNGSDIVVRYLKSDGSLSKEIKIFSLNGVSERFYYTIDFLPMGNTVFHWVDFTRKIFTLIFNSQGDQIIPAKLVTENTASEYIVMDLHGGHNIHGDFYLVWPHYTADGKYRIYAQKYHSDGAKTGSITSISDPANSLSPYYGQISVSADKDGDWAVIWSDNMANAPSTLIYGQFIDRNNNKTGSNYKITGQVNPQGNLQRDPISQWLNDRLYVCFNEKNPGTGSLFTVNMSITYLDDGNVAPQFLSKIEDQVVYSMDTLVITLDESVLYDADLDELNIRIQVDTMTVPPHWVRYEHAGRQVIFTPGYHHHGQYKITLIASDPLMLTAMSEFNLQVISGEYLLPYNGLILNVKDHDYFPFELHVESANIYEGELVKAHEFADARNRQNITWEWMEKSMPGYITGRFFSHLPSEDTWIAVKATDEFGCALHDTLYVIMNTHISVEPLPADFHISVYPNPTDGMVYIKNSRPETTFEPSHISVFDARGKMVFNRDYYGDHSVISIDLTSLSSGIYLMSIVDRQHKRALVRIMIY